MGQAFTGLIVVGLVAVVGAGYYIVQQQEKQSGLPPGGGGNGTLPDLSPVMPDKHEISNLDVFYEQF